MKISVIIPTYKPLSYLWECLNSLIQQTYPKTDFEIILVLNGCCEPYKSDINHYIATSMQGVNINFIQIDEGGVSNARNIALDKAKGEYITFIDDDDFVSPDYLKELYEKASPDTISLAYPYAFEDGNMTQLPYRITDVYNKIACNGKQYYPRARKYFSGSCIKLIPMSFIQERRFNRNFKNGEDSLFMFLISNKFRWVNLTDKSAIYYRRIRLNSATTTKKSISNVIKNSLNLIVEYTRIYLHSPFDYSLSFYFTRILGACKSALYARKNPL